jgi:hypothetical protein
MPLLFILRKGENFGIRRSKLAVGHSSGGWCDSHCSSCMVADRLSKTTATRVETLEACERYESDPVIHKILICLRDARDDKSLTENPRKFRAEISLLLNYLDGLAIGLFQGFYNKNIIRDHMESIIRDHVAEFLDSDFAKKAALDGNGFPSVVKLIREWDDSKPRYKFGRLV